MVLISLLCVLATLFTACGKAAEVGPPSDIVPSGEDPISRGLRFIAASNPGDDPSLTLIFDYLQRRFGLTGLGRHIAFGEQLARSRGEQLYLYGRIFDPKARLEEYETPLAAGIDRQKMPPAIYLPLRALHCDRWPLPHDFREAVESEARSGGYSTTHALLALQWATEQGCLQDQEELRELLRSELIEIARLQSKDDLFAEALAMLYYGGFEASVLPEWIEVLVSTQRSDGSFPFDQTDLLRSHSTALAIWAMSAYEGRGDPAITWIPSPGPPAQQ